MTETRRSAACANGVHVASPHLMHLRQLSIVPLCRCACHSACPVSGGDNALLHDWWDRCVCPGSEQLRAEGRRRWDRDRPPSLGEVQQQVQAEQDVLRRARAAVVSQASGLPAASIRQLLIEQLITQGSDLPSDDVLDWQVSRIQATMPPGATLREGILAVARAYRNKRAADRELRSSLQHPQMLSGPRGEEPYLVLADRSLPMAQVDVDQEVIATLDPEASSVFASLLHDAGDGQFRVEAYIAKRRVGVLSADDGARYQPAMTAARQKGAVLVVQGIISAGPSRDRQLRIYAAGIL
jgi:hypothetical protein